MGHAHLLKVSITEIRFSFWYSELAEKWGIKKNSIEIQKNGFRVVILFLSVTNHRNGRRQSSNAVLNFRCKLNAPAGLFSPPPTTTVRY